MAIGEGGAAERLAAGRERLERSWQRARAQGRTVLARSAALAQRHLDRGYDPRPAGAATLAAPALEVSALTVAYASASAVEEVDATFPPRTMTAIVGPNGAGKSTLLKAIAGTVRPRRGSVTLADATPRDVAYLPQSDEVDRSFPIGVGEFVALGAWREFGAFRAAPDGIAAERDAALAQVGLQGAQERPIAALSVGQFRRALFARLLLQRARVLLLDEPFAAVDAATTADLLRLVEAWQRQGALVIAVLHDLGQVRSYFPRTLLLDRRVVACGETDAVLSPANLAAIRLGEFS